MLEPLTYLGATLVTVVILRNLCPPDTPLWLLILTDTAFMAVLATLRHGPAALVAVLDALARLLSRDSSP